MLTLESDHVQAVWQNLLLIAYASTIAAIPMGDALLFSFTAKKPLAIGVARAVFISSLGATLTMVIIFAIWLALESAYPQLHVDHFLYKLIESQIMAKSFYRIVMLYLFIEFILMCGAALVGGFLASITPFVGEQNQNKTKLSFGSLLLDLPLGLAIISFIQTLTWCLIRYLDRFRPVTSEALQNQQERMIMMLNHATGNLKPNRKVTFEASEPPEVRSERNSNGSPISPTAPILDQSTPGNDSQFITRRPLSSSTTLVPNESSRGLRSSYLRTSQGRGVTPVHSNSSPELPKPQPILNSPAATRAKINRRHFTATKSDSYAIPISNSSHLPKPSPVAVKDGLDNRFISGALGRYAWLRNPSNASGNNFSFPEGSIPYSRSGGIGKTNKPFGASPYQRAAFQRSDESNQDDQSSVDSKEFLSLENGPNEYVPEVHNLRASYTTNSTPSESSLDTKGQYLQQTNCLGSDYSSCEGFGSEADDDEWAEAKSEIAEEAPEKGHFVVW